MSRCDVSAPCVVYGETKVVDTPILEAENPNTVALRDKGR
jgi:hypothetical protein